jgi:hypothetical protein
MARYLLKHSDKFCFTLNLGVVGFDSRRGLEICLFTTAPRTALGLTQPPIQWVQGVLSLRVKRPGREADRSLPSSAEAKEWVELYLHSQYTFMVWCSVKAQGQLYLHATHEISRLAMNPSFWTHLYLTVSMKETTSAISRQLKLNNCDSSTTWNILTE